MLWIVGLLNLLNKWTYVYIFCQGGKGDSYGGLFVSLEDKLFSCVAHTFNVFKFQ